MGKVLPILGIVAAVLSAAFAWAVVGPVIPGIVLLFLWLVAIFLFMERSLQPVLAGALLLLLGLSALLYFNPVVRQGSNLIPDLPALFEGPYQAALCVIAWGAILLARNQEVEPTWMLAAGPLAAALAVLAMVLTPQAQFGNYERPINIAAGVLSLSLIVPMAMLLRGPREAPAPAPSPFQPTRSVPPGLKPAGPVKTIPTVAAPLKKAPAHLPPDAPPKGPARKSPPK